MDFTFLYSVFLNLIVSKGCRSLAITSGAARMSCVYRNNGINRFRVKKSFPMVVNLLIFIFWTHALKILGLAVDGRGAVPEIDRI